MAKIPLGDFGNAIAQPRPTINHVAGAYDKGGAALADLGNEGLRITSNLMEEKRQENEALSRARAANAVLDHEIQYKTLEADITNRLSNGELRYDAATEALDAAAQFLDKPEIGKLDPATQLNLDKGYKRIEFQTRQGIERAAEGAKKAEFRGQTDSAMDKLGKLTGLPGADVEKINAQIDTLDPLGQTAYGPAWEKKKQDFKDGNWANHAVQRSVEARQDMEALRQLEHDLVAEDGFYTQKLDVAKRNAVLSQVVTNRIQLENRMIQQSAKREVKAERALNDIDKQIASGVPATAEMWAGWAETVKGTPIEEELKARIQEEIQVQQVLRQPINDQLAFIQTREAELMTKGGSVRDKSNLDRMKTAVQANIKQLQENPLIFNQSRTGTEVEPLVLAKLLDPAASTELSLQLRDRWATLSTMKKEYGSQVKMHPLLPQEVAQLGAVLEQGTYRQRSEILKTVRAAFGDDAGYMAAMRQLAPDSPVRAMAGMIAAKERGITLDRKTFGADVTSKSGDVADTLLLGEDLLNKSKAQKAQDGNSKTFPMPKDADFNLAFADTAGSVFAGRPGAYDVAMQAVKAYYVGRASIDGDISGEVDSRRLKQALAAVIGQVVDYNGNGEVLAPWGMGADEFEEKAAAALEGELGRRGIRDLVGGNLGALGLKNYGDSTYYVVQGRNFLYDKQGKPVVVDLNARPSAQAVSGKVKP
jgi:hypothetical protein